MLPGAEADHRLDREDHPGAHDHRVTCVVIVQHLNVGMELLADAVPDERPNDSHAMGLRVILDRFTDVTQWLTWNNGFDALPHALFGNFHQQLALVIDIADKKSRVRVAVDALHETGDVEIDDVAIAQNR